MLFRSHLSKDEGCVVLEVDLAGADGGDRGGPTAEGALAGLLGGGVHGLPATHSWGEVRSGHPTIIPHMEVPVETGWGGVNMLPGGRFVGR